MPIFLPSHFALQVTSAPRSSHGALCVTWQHRNLGSCFRDVRDYETIYPIYATDIWNGLWPITKTGTKYIQPSCSLFSLFSSSKIRIQKNLITNLQTISNLARVIVTSKDRLTISCWCSTAQTRKHKIFLSHARTEKAPFSSLTWPKKILCRSIESASRKNNVLTNLSQYKHGLRYSSTTVHGNRPLIQVEGTSNNNSCTFVSTQMTFFP